MYLILLFMRKHTVVHAFWLPNYARGWISKKSISIILFPHMGCHFRHWSEPLKAVEDNGWIIIYEPVAKRVMILNSKSARWSQSWQWYVSLGILRYCQRTYIFDRNVRSLWCLSFKRSDEFWSNFWYVTSFCMTPWV